MEKMMMPPARLMSVMMMPATASPGHFLIDESGIQIRIDGHLFSRHGIQGKSRSDFRYSACTIGYYHHLHDGDDDENYSAHHIVVPGDKGSKGIDDFSRISFTQNEPCGGDIKPQTEHGHHKEKTGENGEFQNTLSKKRQDEDHHGDGQIHGEQKIQKKGGHRKNDDGNDTHHSKGYENFSIFS